MRKKQKKKNKGKKRYKNTHGNWYRTRLSYRFKRKIEQRKSIRELNEQRL